MTIHIQDDLARGLQAIAMAQQTSVEELAVERLRMLVDQSLSPQALLRRIQALPHPSAAAVDELEGAIAAGRIAVRDDSDFKSSPAQ